MISPKWKTKLPSTQSYPIGFREIEQGLSTVPFSDEIQMWYSKNYDFSAMEFAKHLTLGKPHVVMKATYRHHVESWALSVYPVARERKMVARKALLDESLPKLAEWYARERPPIWYWGLKECKVIFDPLEGTVWLAGDE